MHCLGFISLLIDLVTLNLIKRIPRHIQGSLVCHPVVNAVAPENNEIMKVWPHFKLRNLWLSNYNAFFSTVL
jgi:hypothetical protein